MKKLIVLSSLLALGITAQAQVAKWVTHPVYDGVTLAEGAPFFVCDSLGLNILRDIKGKKLGATPDSICGFRENKAVTIKKGTNEVTGFLNSDGSYVKLGDYMLPHGFPYFSDGHLLVTYGEKYIFLDAKGEESLLGFYAKAFPFQHGFSAFKNYESWERKKDTYFNYVRADGEMVDYEYEGKFYPAKQVKFISSLNAEGKGIVALKKKLFFYDGATMKLTPIFADPNETNIKRQIYLDGDLEECLFLDEDNNGYQLLAKNGKKEDVFIVFDHLMRPLKIKFANREQEFKKPSAGDDGYSSPLKAFRAENGEYGIEADGKEVLPAQFDSISRCLNDMAIVCKKGKWGVIKVYKDTPLKLKMNKGNDIAFRHQKYETSIRLNLPVDISSKNCRFNISEKNGCLIDKTSIETHDTESGNFVQYTCELTIPESLPDVLTEITYPVDVVADGIKFSTIPLKVKAWHYKYISLDLNREEMVYEKGNVAFTINLVAEKRQGEADYPVQVEVEGDSVKTELEKISETRYVCRAFGLQPGFNNVMVKILETGCPAVKIPLEVVYRKSSPRRVVNRVVIPAKKEGVIVRKKEDAVLNLSGKTSDDIDELFDQQLPVTRGFIPTVPPAKVDSAEVKTEDTLIQTESDSTNVAPAKVEKTDSTQATPAQVTEKTDSTTVTQ